MRHIGILAGAALAVCAPTMASAQMGAPAGAPMQPGGWSQGGWQSGGAVAPGPQGYTERGDAEQSYGQQGYAPQGGGYRSHAMDDRGDYRRLARGKHLPGAYLDSRYTVSDWNDWGFAPPGPGMRWVRYYDDGMLVDPRGRIVDARYGVDWDRGYRHGPNGFDHGPRGYAGGAGIGYPGPGVSTYRAGPDTIVTTAIVQAPPPVIVGRPAYGYAGGYARGYAGGYYAGGGSVISVTPGIAVTTTTTTTDYETVYKSVAVRRQAWRRPIRHYRPHCVRATSCPVLGS